jgi:type III pantothenate kinase
VQTLPAPVDTLSIGGVRPEFDQLTGWVERAAPPVLSWWIGSVNRPATTLLLDWLRSARPQDAVTLLVSADLPLVIRLPEPDRVGIDRLLDAVAANMLRSPGRPAVVVDVGTAITVDLVSADGAFCGGAILPGTAMSARALTEFTDLLPQVDVADLGEPPPLVGKTTVQAMHSGLFWSAVGAVRELASRMLAEQQPANGSPEPRSPSIFLTGGAVAAMAGLLGSRACLVPHLTLAGIALTAQASAAGSLQGQPQPE